jgi:hypothetical protein
MSISLSSNFPGNFSRAVTPELDRRAHTERRTQMKPMPAPERSWARHALIAGCLGALLGSTAAFALLQKQYLDAAGNPTSGTVVEPNVPAVAVMAPLFDTAPFAANVQSGVPSASTSLFNAQSTANPGTESYSEDAAGVPSAMYHEPPRTVLASPAR